MEKEKVLFVYNPRAGKGTLRNKLADIIDLMMKRQWDVSIAATQKAGDAAEYIIQKGIGCDRVICSGGDGTLHEVIHGLMALPPDMRPACGYIPTGTVNDFANSIKMCIRDRCKKSPFSKVISAMVSAVIVSIPFRSDTPTFLIF